MNQRARRRGPLTCGICGQRLSEKPKNVSKNPKVLYAVRFMKPVICNECTKRLYSIVEKDNQNDNCNNEDITVVANLRNIIEGIEFFEGAYEGVYERGINLTYSIKRKEIDQIISKEGCLRLDLAKAMYDSVEAIMKEERDYLKEKVAELVDKKTDIEPVEDKKGFSPKEMFKIIEYIKTVIKGQDEAIKKIVITICKKMLIKSANYKSNLIIMGPTGVGKTKIIQLLTRELNVPFVIEDATRYTEAGYIGADVEDIIRNLYMSSNCNKELTENGIVIIDEGDKKGGGSYGGIDVSREAVQHALLKMIEGTKVILETKAKQRIAEIDTSNITFVVIGAFPGIKEIRDKRLNKKGKMGFSSSSESLTIGTSELTAEDFKEYGFNSEFIGRFSAIVELNPLNEETLAEIILNSEESAFKNHIGILKNRGVDLKYDDDVIKAIASETSKLNLGARAIKRVVEKMFEDILMEILSREKAYKECKIYPETVTNPNRYELKLK